MLGFPSVVGLVLPTTVKNGVMELLLLLAATSSKNEPRMEGRWQGNKKVPRIQPSRGYPHSSSKLIKCQTGGL